MLDTEVSRDGFTYAYGNLYAIGHIQRIDGDRLKEMFLPAMSEEAKTAVRPEFHFVRAQLQHYGIEFSQRGFSGNGVAILKEALRAGKVRIRRPRCNGRLLTPMQCDQVPNSVLLLKSQMHKEWLRKCRDKDLAKYPMYYHWILEKYFMDSWSRAEPSRTKGVVGPLPYHSVEASNVISILGRRIGLTKAVGAGSPDVLFLGWDSIAVRRAAFNYIGKEDDDSESEEESQFVSDAPKIPSPAEKYDINCDIITREFSLGRPFAKDHMTMTIRTTHTPGFYQARFNLDAIEGVMMMSANEALLKAFVSDSRIDSGEDSDLLGNETGSRERVLERIARKRILKRKRRMPDAAAKGSGPAVKKIKTGPVGRPSRYFFRVRCRDLGNYEIWNMGKGTVKFNGPGLTGFTGQGGLGAIGDEVLFSGRKIAGGGGGRGKGSDEDEDDDEMDDESEEEETDSGAETDYAWDKFAG